MSKRHFQLNCLIGILCCILIQPANAQNEKRIAVPDVEVLKSFAGESENLFETEFKLSDFESRVKLVELLVTQSRSDGIPPAKRYYFLSEALRVAMLNVDSSSSLFVIDRLDASFDVDFWQLANDSMKSLSRKAKSPAELESAKRTLDQLANQAIVEEEYSIARLMISRSMTVTRKLNDAIGMDELKELRGQVTELEKISDAGRIAKAKLARFPVDAKANLDRGNYLIFVKGDFRNGLKCWTKSKSDIWFKVAEAELNLDMSDVVKSGNAIGDLWLKASRRVKGFQSEVAERRAQYWHNKVVEMTNSAKQTEIAAKIAQRKNELNDVTTRSPNAIELDPKSKAAVDLALQWIVKHQLPDGGWSFNHTLGPGNFRQTAGPGSLKDARGGATGLALMALVRAGSTHKKGPYKDQVYNGVKFLGARAQRTSSGVSYSEPGGTMYSHGIVAQVFCELYQKTKDRKLLPVTRGTIRYIEYSQDPIGGGWRYRPREPGDTSVTAWQLGALDKAKQAGLTVDPRVEALAMKFLDSVNSKDQLAYGYTSPPRGKFSKLTPSGLLGRLDLGWDVEKSEFVASAKTIVERGPDIAKNDSYYNYHGMLLMKQHGGPEWEQWRKPLRDQLIKLQGATGDETGSWSFGTRAHADEKGGRLYQTALSTLILLEN